MKNKVKQFFAVICLASILFSSCSKNQSAELTPLPEEEKPVEKDEWASYSTTTKDIGEMNWSFALGSKIYFGILDPQLQVYNTTSKAWEAAINLPATFEQRVGAVVTVHNNKAYIGGGYGMNGDEFLDWWEFDPAAGTPWKRLTDCPVPQVHGVAFVVNEILYTGLAVNYINNQTIQNNFYKYKFSDNTWNPTPVNTPTQCGGHGFGLVVKNKIYFGAGVKIMPDGGQEETKKCFELDPATSTTKAIADFPERLAVLENAVTFQANDKGYVLVPGNALYQYDPTANTWKKLKSIPVETNNGKMRYSFRVGEKIFAVTETGKVFEYIYK